jgi:hypothetical protein
MPEDLRKRVVSYLRGCPVFLAWMEHTTDQIGGKFGVDGGSAIASDGQYYWRLDGIAYIEEYGIPIPIDALDRFRAAGWTPPSIERPEYLRIYAVLDEMLGGGSPVD